MLHEYDERLDCYESSKLPKVMPMMSMFKMEMEDPVGDPLGEIILGIKSRIYTNVALFPSLSGH